MSSHIDMRYWEALWAVIRRASSIGRHVEFFQWLQSEVGVFLPHDVLVAVWGDFDNGRLHYDVASNIPDIRTRKIMSGNLFDPLMRSLYQRWLHGGEKWYVLDNAGFASKVLAPDSHISALDGMRSVLVHGIRDRRGKNDCLYAFFDKDILIEADPTILEILVPQIDAVLRRVECLSPQELDEIGLAGTACEISDRESQIMEWVCSGKTNHEIGLILKISPNTVKNHLKRIFQKLDVSSRAQAVAKYASTARI